MKNRKRLFMTGLLVFSFINVGIFSSAAYKIPLTTKGNILYVGGSGPGNYSKIQDAIDDASPGDTVFVFSGTYYEYHILVDKTLALIGEDKYTTIIDGENRGDLLYIKADNVYISGFTFQSSDVQYTEAIYQSYCNRSTITNNLIRDIDGGWGSIWLTHAYNNTIANNTFSSVCGTCLFVTFSSNNVVSGNNFSNNGAGITTWHTTHTVIKENIISNIGAGIIIDNADGIDSNDFNGYNTITMNTIANNSYCGIYLHVSHSNTISMNNIVNNKLGIWNYWSNSNKIEKNNFIGNARDAKFEFAFKTSWNANYWGKPRLLPKPLFGIFYEFPIPFPVPINFPIEGIPIPSLQFDWHPTNTPYEIT